MRRSSPESQQPQRNIDEVIRSLGFNPQEYRQSNQVVLRVDGRPQIVTLSHTPLRLVDNGDIAIQYDDAGGMTHAEVITVQDQKKGRFPEVIRQVGSSFIEQNDIGERTQYEVTQVSLLPGGSIEYGIRENFVGNGGQRRVENHQGVPAELLRTFQRVLFLREQVRQVETNLTTLAREHQQSFADKKTAIDKQVMDLWDKLPDLKDMTSASQEDVREVQRQMEKLMEQAEESVRVLQGEIALHTPQANIDRSLHEHLLTDEEKKELSQLARRLQQSMLEEGERISKRIDATRGTLEQTRKTELTANEQTKRTNAQATELARKRRVDLPHLQDQETEHNDNITRIDAELLRVENLITQQQQIVNDPATPDRERKQAQKQQITLENQRSRFTTERAAARRELTKITRAIRELEDEINNPPAVVADVSSITLPAQDSENISIAIERQKKAQINASQDNILQRLATSTNLVDRELFQYVVALRQAKARTAASGASLVGGTTDTYDFTDPVRQAEENRKIFSEVLTQLNTDELNNIPDVLRPVESLREGKFNFSKEYKELLEGFELLKTKVTDARGSTKNTSRLDALLHDIQNGITSYTTRKTELSSLRAAMSHGIADKQDLQDQRLALVEGMGLRLDRYSRDFSAITRELSPVGQKIEIKGEHNIEFTAEVMERILEFFPDQYHRARETLYRNGVDTNGHVTPEALAAFQQLIPNQQPADPAIARMLRDVGIKDWNKFKEQWDKKIAQTVVQTMAESAAATIRARLVAELHHGSGIGSFFSQLKSDLGQKYRLKSVALNLATFGGTGMLLGKGALLLGLAASPLGVVAVAGTTAAVGTFGVGALMKKFGKSFIKPRTAQQPNPDDTKFAQLLEKRREYIINEILSEPSSSTGVGVPLPTGHKSKHVSTLMFDSPEIAASAMAHAINQHANKDIQVGDMTLSGEARQIYMTMLRETTAADATAEEQKQLALAILELVQKRAETTQTTADATGTSKGEDKKNSEMSWSDVTKNAIKGGLIAAAFAPHRALATAYRTTTAAAGGAVMGWHGAEGIVRDQISKEAAVNTLRERFDVTRELLDQIKNNNGATNAATRADFEETLRYLRRVRSKSLQGHEEYAYQFLFDQKTKKPTMLYKSLMGLLTEAERVNLEYRLFPEAPNTRLRLEVALVELRRQAQTNEEQQTEKDRLDNLVSREGNSGKHLARKIGHAAVYGVAFGVSAFAMTKAVQFGMDKAGDFFGNDDVKDSSDKSEKSGATTQTNGEQTTTPEQDDQTQADSIDVVDTSTSPEIHLSPDIDAQGNHLLETATISAHGGLENGETMRNNVWGTLDRFEDATDSSGRPLFDNHQEFREWRTEQLQALGYRQVDGHWGHPFTVHEGAKVELYVDTNGDPHARVVGTIDGPDRTITVHDHLRFRDVDARIEGDNNVLQQRLDEIRAHDRSTPITEEQRQAVIHSDRDDIVGRNTILHPEADLNNDGQVQNEEMVRFVDTNRDGTLSPQEWADLRAGNTTLVGMELNAPRDFSGGTGGFVSSSIPAEHPTSFSSTFAANNPDVVRGGAVGVGEGGVAPVGVEGNHFVPGATLNTEQGAVSVPNVVEVPVTYDQMMPQHERVVLDQMRGMVQAFDSVSPTHDGSEMIRTVQNELHRMASVPGELPVVMVNGHPQIALETLADQIAQRHAGDISQVEALVLLGQPDRFSPVFGAPEGSHALTVWWGGQTHAIFDTDHMYAVDGNRVLMWENGAPRDTAVEIQGWNDKETGIEPITASVGDNANVDIPEALMNYLRSDLVAERGDIINLGVSGPIADDLNIDFVNHYTNIIDNQPQLLGQYYNPMSGTLDIDRVHADWISTIHPELQGDARVLIAPMPDNVGPGEQVYFANGSHSFKFATDQGQYVVSDVRYRFGTLEGTNQAVLFNVSDGPSAQPVLIQFGVRDGAPYFEPISPTQVASR